MSGLLSVVQVNSIGIVLMVIILFSLTTKSGIVGDRLFFMLVLSVMIVCFLEIMGTVFDHKTFDGARTLNRVFNALLFAANPVPALLWALYANNKIYDNEKILKKSSIFLCIPILIVIILSFANVFTDVFFTITPNNTYMRTDYFFVATLMSVFYMIYVAVIIFLQRKSIGKKLFLPLLSFMILPAIGLTLQFLFYGLYLLWVSVAAAVIVIFNYVQNDNSITDWLTGLYNRKHLETYLLQVCKKRRDNYLIGFMLDIDCFKNINDTYGHLIGDKVLKDLILTNSFGKRAYIARFAGDEFVALLEVKDKDSIEASLSNINNSLYAYNLTSKNPFKLEISIGHALYKGANNETVEDFVKRMDTEMYRIKNEKKISRTKANQPPLI